MATNMDALLRIKASASGGEQITALGDKFNRVQGAASKLTSGVGLLGPALGALAPVATIGGIGALVTKTIQAGDAMYDMSQRTGVSVEALARFKKVAATSGTDLDSVAKSLSKLSKGLYEAATTGKGSASDALDALGISAKDASGNIKAADKVTLEIADRFKGMPDGVEKTALAMKLFGKSGAEMIPMLNEGSKAIESLSVKMTTAFAKKADEYGDKLAKLSGKVGGLTADLAIALLPALELVTNAVTAVVDVFSKLPGPIQAVIGLAALLAIGFAALAPIVTSLVAVLGALQGLAIGATLAGWLGALGPLVAGFGAFIAGVVASPVLIGAALIAAGVLIFAFRDKIGAVLAGLILSIWKAIDGFNQAIRSGITSIWQWLADGVARISGALYRPFEMVTDTIRNVVNSVLQFVTNGVNGALGLVNNLIQSYNRLPTPDLPTIPLVSVPRFASGAYVTGPTLAQVGEGGQPEYVIPASRMGAAAAAYQSGARGVDVVNGTATTTGPSITIQTGQVVQLPDGSQWVSMADLEAAMRATAAGVMGQLRSPAGRVAMGGA